MSVDIVLLALITGHLVGDFIFQSDALARRQATNTRLTFLHVSIVAGSTWIFLGTISAWPVVLAALVTHTVIDLIRNRLPRPSLLAEPGCATTER